MWFDPSCFFFLHPHLKGCVRAKSSRVLTARSFSHQLLNAFEVSAGRAKKLIVAIARLAETQAGTEMSHKALCSSNPHAWLRHTGLAGEGGLPVRDVRQLSVYCCKGSSPREMSMLCQLEVNNRHGLDRAVGKASMCKEIRLGAAAASF